MCVRETSMRDCLHAKVEHTSIASGFFGGMGDSDVADDEDDDDDDDEEEEEDDDDEEDEVIDDERVRGCLLTASRCLSTMLTWCSELPFLVRKTMKRERG